MNLINNVIKKNHRGSRAARRAHGGHGPGPSVGTRGRAQGFVLLQPLLAHPQPALSTM